MGDEQTLGIDFADLDGGPTINPGWQPDPQELVYTAINHVRGDYGDADENAGEQIVERLLILLRVNLRLLAEATNPSPSI